MRMLVSKHNLPSSDNQIPDRCDVSKVPMLFLYLQVYHLPRAANQVPGGHVVSR